ncbi:hypothetical protein JYK22_09615, partial [Nonomuraea sp. RK-328]|nr:hypothetical protein [Nonomuraea sp. RK-328]
VAGGLPGARSSASPVARRDAREVTGAVVEGTPAPRPACFMTDSLPKATVCFAWHAVDLALCDRDLTRMLRAGFMSETR